MLQIARQQNQIGEARASRAIIWITTAIAGYAALGGFYTPEALVVGDVARVLN